MAKMDRKISRQLEAAGWVLRGNGKGKHEKWVCGCGEHGPIIKATSMGGGRGAANFRSLMRKQGDCSIDIKLG